MWCNWWNRSFCIGQYFQFCRNQLHLIKAYDKRDRRERETLYFISIILCTINQTCRWISHYMHVNLFISSTKREQDPWQKRMKQTKAITIFNVYCYIQYCLRFNIYWSYNIPLYNSTSFARTMKWLNQIETNQTSTRLVSIKCCYV